MNNVHPEIALALQSFRSHSPVAIPTETVYGLAAPVSDLKAVRAIFELKKRPLFNPLIIHISSIEMARQYVRTWPAVCDLFAQHFWPGPLTMILPKNHKVSDLITAGHPTLGLRMPNHPLTLELIAAQGEALAAPSANKFSHTSPSCAQHVQQQFNRPLHKLLVLDGGACTVGIESTVCEVREKTKEILIYRPGMLGPRNMTSLLEKHGIRDYHIHYQKGQVSPGQLSTHYRPEKPLVVYGKDMNRKEVLSAIQKHWPNSTPFECSLSHDPYLAARTLYKTLHNPKINDYDVMMLYAPIDLSQGPWVALKDRLQKAASLLMLKT